jgi:hypothetical protein
MSVVPDDRLGLRGFEHHAFKCLACNDTQQHRVFTKYGRECDPEPMPVIPQCVLQQLHHCRAGPAPSFLWRVVAKLRGRPYLQEQPVVLSIIAPTE